MAWEKRSAQRGFSLAELLVAMALAGIVGMAMVMSFSNQSKTFIKQEQTIDVQQNVRGAMDIMVRDIRMACYNPKGESAFLPVTLDVRPRNLNNAVAAAGWGAMEFRKDSDDDGVLDAADTVRYSLYDSTDVSPAGILELARQENPTGGGDRQPLVSYVEGLVFAFAYDTDGDRQVERDGAGEIIWAVDSDADGDLNLNVATNAALAADVLPTNIQAVRIWLLARSARREEGLVDTRTYQLGHRTVTPAGPARFFQRRLLTETVWLRNASFRRS